jgi:cytochrome b pre-mRNA-processing protein 3
MNILKTIREFFCKTPTDDPVATALYHACVAQARRPAFYRDMQIPDTVDGRFDLLLLHVYMVIKRLKDYGTIKQNLFDLMFADMDRSLREMGVGDMSIGKKIKPMLAAFYGRAQAYDQALAGNDTDLATTLTRNLYGAVVVSDEAVAHIIKYVRQTTAMLDTQPDEAVVAGKINFDQI